MTAVERYQPRPVQHRDLHAHVDLPDWSASQLEPWTEQRVAPHHPTKATHVTLNVHGDITINAPSGASAPVPLTFILVLVALVAAVVIAVVIATAPGERPQASCEETTNDAGQAVIRCSAR